MLHKYKHFDGNSLCCLWGSLLKNLWTWKWEKRYLSWRCVPPHHSAFLLKGHQKLLKACGWMDKKKCMIIARKDLKEKYTHKTTLKKQRIKHFKRTWRGKKLVRITHEKSQLSDVTSKMGKCVVVVTLSQTIICFFISAEWEKKRKWCSARVRAKRTSPFQPGKVLIFALSLWVILNACWRK